MLPGQKSLEDSEDQMQASTAVAFNKEEEIKKAVETAKNADVVILFIGTTLDTEAEGRDRTTLAITREPGTAC